MKTGAGWQTLQDKMEVSRKISVRVLAICSAVGACLLIDFGFIGEGILIVIAGALIVPSLSLAGAIWVVEGLSARYPG